MEAVILCGGLGTRLRPVIGDSIPKCMAPVKGQPFLNYLFDFLIKNEVQRVVLATGHNNEPIHRYYGRDYKGMRISYSHERTTLGTGGALVSAMRYCKTDNIVVCNGDSLFYCDLVKMIVDHLERKSNITMAVTKNNHMEFKNPYLIDTYVNCGLYVIDKLVFRDFGVITSFSFENDFLPKYMNRDGNKINAYYSEGYFIDIGTPEDYKRANKEL